LIAFTEHSPLLPLLLLNSSWMLGGKRFLIRKFPAPHIHTHIKCNVHLAAEITMMYFG